MRVFITGGTGLIGRRIVLDRLQRGDQVVILTRGAKRAAKMFAAASNPNVSIIQGDPREPGPWQSSIDGCDAVVNLAGASIAGRRWSRKYKDELVQSRINSTRNVAEAIGKANHRPQVLLSASAIGYYGETGEIPTDESAPPANDFLADLCVKWEAEARRAQSHGTRVGLLRTGLVLDPRGGALPQMMRPYKMMLGGSIGAGRHFMSWIHWMDVLGLVHLALVNGAVSGPLNLCAPNPVRNREFSAALAKAMGKSSWFPVPRFALHIVMGEIARYAVMSQRVVPGRAKDHRYQFMYADIYSALVAILRRKQAAARGAIPVHTAPRSKRKDQGRAGGAMPSAPIKLLSIDIDGTLLRTDRTITPETVASCRAAQQAGCHIVLATARSPVGVEPLLHTLGLHGLVIASHGALVWDAVGRTAMYEKTLDGATARTALDMARQIDPAIFVGVEVRDCWHTDRKVAVPEADTARLVEPDSIGPLEAVFNDPVTRLNLWGELGSISGAALALQEELEQTGKARIIHSDPKLIQIISAQANKADALRWLAEHLNVQPLQVMAIGDADNDAEMIQWAGFGVAMGNAADSIKRFADAVVESNDDGGVAKAIHRYVLALR